MYLIGSVARLAWVCYPSMRWEGISLSVEGEITPVPPIEFRGQIQEWKALTLMRKLSGLSHPQSLLFRASSWFLTCPSEPDRPVAAWPLDEHRGTWCKVNTSSERGIKAI